jgi:WD40 repeat protein
LLGNGKVLVTGGINASNVPQASAELYDQATGSFTSAGTMTGARFSHTATLLATGTVLIAGGGTATAEIYDPTGGVFVATGSMNKSRTNLTATLLNDGRVLIAGGGGDASAEIYDPGSGTFALASNSMTAGRTFHTATLLGNGKVLLVGGEDAVAATHPTLASAESFDPSTNSFSAIANSLATSRELHTATLAGGKVYLIGGRTGSAAGYNFLSSAEVFDPSTGSFSTSAAALNTARTTHTATLLNNGKVLIAGGFNSGSLSSAEIFDPAGAGSFTATGTMSTARYLHTATRLASGNVLLTGGLSGGSIAVSSAEVYAPGP